VNLLVLARMSFWKYEKEKREKGFSELKKVLRKMGKFLLSYF